MEGIEILLDLEIPLPSSEDILLTLLAGMDTWGRGGRLGRPGPAE
jgi:hypothetical protein